ncbi:MAG: phage tail protein [Ilumatobacteraceae bacterium]
MSDREVTSRAGLPATTKDRLSERLGYGAGWLVGALPLGMQGDDFMVRFLTIFEEVATTLRAASDSVTSIADVDVTSPEMVRYLGEWVGAPALDKRLDIQKQRDIVHATGATIGHRGTANALRVVLQALIVDHVRKSSDHVVALGAPRVEVDPNAEEVVDDGVQVPNDVHVEVIDEGGVFREGEAPTGAGTVTVRLSSTGHLRKAQLVELVLASVPANVQVVVECAGERLYPNPDPTPDPPTIEGAAS